VNRITGEELISGNASKDPWAAVTPPVARAMAEKAANSFATWLPTHNGHPSVATASVGQPVGVGGHPSDSLPTPAEPAPRAGPAASKSAAAGAAPTTGSIARAGGLMAVVPSVTGAPGDGTQSLTAAIQQELASKGVAVSDKASGAYRVEGAVVMGQAKDGKQSIHIEWTVRDPTGKKLGTVSQRNEIPEGSLNGAWGKTAEQAAGAAAQGIIKLLPAPKAVN